MRLLPAVAVPIALIVTCVTSLAAQVRPGQPVRWIAGDSVHRALFRESAPDGRIIVDTPDSAVVLDPAARIIEYRNGNRTKWGSAGIGLMAGGLLGAISGLAGGDDTCRGGGWCILSYTAEQKAVLGFVGGGMIGAIVGVVAIPASRWTQLRTGSDATVALLVEPRRLGVAVRF